MSKFNDDLDPYQKRNESIHREAEFEEWRKVLLIFFLDGDVNHDFEDEPVIWPYDEPITLEKVRAIFSIGYRFAMLQALQCLQVKEGSLNIEDIKRTDIQNFKEFKKQLDQFLELKIEDSFGLNSIERRENFNLSKKLKEDFRDLKERNVLAWR
jgi:hypothetical protein